MTLGFEMKFATSLSILPSKPRTFTILALLSTTLDRIKSEPSMLLPKPIPTQPLMFVVSTRMRRLEPERTASTHTVLPVLHTSFACNGLRKDRVVKDTKAKVDFILLETEDEPGDCKIGAFIGEGDCCTDWGERSNVSAFVVIRRR